MVMRQMDVVAVEAHLIVVVLLAVHQRLPAAVHAPQAVEARVVAVLQLKCGAGLHIFPHPALRERAPRGTPTLSTEWAALYRAALLRPQTGLPVRPARWYATRLATEFTAPRSVTRHSSGRKAAERPKINTR